MFLFLNGTTTPCEPVSKRSKKAELHSALGRMLRSGFVIARDENGDPWVNIQYSSAGMAKAYQVRQVLAAIDKLEVIP